MAVIKPDPRPVVGPRLRWVLLMVLALFSLLAINGLYLGAVTLAEYLTGRILQNLIYQYLFLAHLLLGLALLLPFVIYGAVHAKNAHDRPNRRAVKVGIALLICGAVLLVSGMALTRGIPALEVRPGQLRDGLYWAHVITPLIAVWLYILHRLAGKRIAWRVGGGVTALALILALVGTGGLWLVARPQPDLTTASYFEPSLARTSGNALIPAHQLMTDAYCAECHEDIHERWSYSAHRFASFNNPAYLFSVRATRQKMLARDASLNGSRFCAGCHDPVPFFSGAFDDPKFDDVNDPTSQAGITCVACHAIESINSPRGNADYTLGLPGYYPFTFADNPVLAFANRFMIKARPGFHKRSFLKPLHQSAEFCGACHKVHLPESLNAYRWLRGQNHYDSFLLSGVSGASVSSFYYPEKAQPNCNGCHMTTRASDDFAARPAADGTPSVHDHLFPSANTALGALLDHPELVGDAHREMLEGSVTVDLFGLREGGQVDGRQIAPLDQPGLTLKGGQSYLLEVVLRTRTLGHLFTQGTADSNEVWLEVALSAGGRPLAVNGALSERGDADRQAHYVNAFVLDRDGRRIAERNAEDIFTTLYNHQIPPGAADVVLYRFTLPEDFVGPLRASARLRYRKFDSDYYRAFSAQPDAINPLPITDIDSVAVTVGEGPGSALTWQRWNDYGIGLLRKPGSGALRQAEAAFGQVAALAPGHGNTNLARVYLREGRLLEAERALQRASEASDGWPWVMQWLTAELEFQNGFIDQAIERWRGLTETPFAAARERELDFSRDYRLLERLAGALYEASRAYGAGLPQRDDLLAEARDWYLEALALDPERAASHYGLAQVYAASGDEASASQHRQWHTKYKVDDNARDKAIAAARARYPAAARAADPVAVYPLEPLQ